MAETGKFRIGKQIYDFTIMPEMFDFIARQKVIVNREELPDFKRAFYHKTADPQIALERTIIKLRNEDQ